MTFKHYNTMKFIKRNVQTNNQKVKVTVYNTYVRHQLEYCAPVWHPGRITVMFNTLNWQTLESRRIKSSLTLLFKTINHFYLTETRNLNFFVPISRTKYHMNSFSPRTTIHWNSLPYSLKASPSLCEFTTWLATVTF